MEATTPEYERLRKKNIENNNKKLQELGLKPIGTSTFKKPEDPGYVTLNYHSFTTGLLHLRLQVNNMFVL